MNKYLEERIEWYDKNYRIGRALITDKQFDQLEKNLLRINPKCDYFKNKNNLFLPSLAKNETKQFLEGLLPNTRLLIEPKIDGCAIAIKYINGKFDSAITREGKDVTREIKAIKNVPEEIKIGSRLVVRGELFAPKERPSYSQKIASGYLRSDSFEPNPKISFCAFQIINTKTNEYESLIHLRNLGFAIPEIIEANRTSQVETFRRAWLNKKLFNNFPTDGIVVKINSRKLQLLREKSFGVYPHWQIAIKN